MHLTQRGNLGVVSQISAGKWMRLLIQEDGNFFGTIVADGATYVARAGKDGTAFHSTAEKTVATSPFENDALPVTPIADAEEGGSSWSASASPSVVSVGILYDNELASVDQNLLLNWIDELLFVANQTYQSSGVNVEFVAVAATNYEPGATLDMQGELAVVSCGSPGCRLGVDVNNQVLGWRDSVRADLVVQLVGTGSGGSCGLGWVPQPGISAASFRLLAYSVSAVQNSVGSACPSSVLAHEVGHNLGLAHDRTTGGSPLFTYGWGYRLPDGYGTNMSYPERGIRGGYVPYLSNPNISISSSKLGEPIGNPNEAFAAQAVANTIPTFSATYDNSDVALVPPPPVLENVTSSSTAATVFFQPKRNIGQPTPTFFTANCGGTLISGSSSPITLTGLSPVSSYSCSAVSYTHLTLPTN